MDLYCKFCDGTKPAAEFDRDKRSPTGRTTKCRSCRKAYIAVYYSDPANRERQRANTKKYIATTAGKACQKRYNLTDKGRATSQRRSAKYRRANLDKVAAQQAVHRRVASGKLAPPADFSCTYCPAPAVEYHHHKGYGKANRTDVVPVCKACHAVTVPRHKRAVAGSECHISRS